MSKKPLTPEVGPWAEEKLGSLRDYLNAYTKILHNKGFEGYVYIDAFAGAGMAKIRQKKEKNQIKDNMLSFDFFDKHEREEYAEYVKGSPRVALEIKHPFTHYFFIELDKNRRNELEKLKEEYPKRNIKIREQDCNEYLQKLAQKPSELVRWRAFVFLDPYGAHVPWETVNTLGNAKSFEVLINFPWMAITRLANNNGKIRKKFRKTLDLYFGTDEWFDVMYEKHKNLWDDTTYDKERHASEIVVNWYVERLKTTFKYVSEPRPIKNTKGGLLYYLIWAGHNPKGMKIAEHILGRDNDNRQKKLPL